MRYLIKADPRLKIEKPWELTCAPEVIYFTGEVSEESSMAFRRDMEVAESSALQSGQEVLPICIDSFGGCVYSLLSMIDAIDACSVPIATIVEGKAMSCGSILASCGTRGHRYMGPNATQMIHTITTHKHGKMEDVEVDMEQVKILYEKVFTRMEQNMGKRKGWIKSELKARNNSDWYLTAKECKENGFIDHIGIPVMEYNLSVSNKLRPR